MFETLKNQGSPDGYVRILQEMYKNLKARIITEVKGQYFQGKKEGGETR